MLPTIGGEGSKDEERSTTTTNLQEDEVLLPPAIACEDDHTMEKKINHVLV